jgi:hypothetical protein
MYTYISSHRIVAAIIAPTGYCLNDTVALFCLCVCVFVLFASLLELTLQLAFGMLSVHVNK